MPKPKLPPLSPEAIEYQSLLRSAMLAGAMLQPFDIDGALVAIGRSHAIGPILDPTLYRDKVDAMELDAELLKAARPLWRLARDRMNQLTARYAEELKQAEELVKEVTRP